MMENTVKEPGSELRSSPIVTWWQDLQKRPGERARLRRCHNPVEVAFEPSYHRLVTMLGGTDRVNLERVAVVAGVLAHVREYDPSMPFAVQMAKAPEGTGKAKVSGFRFRRLIQVSDTSGLYEPVIRTVALLGGRVNVDDLGKNLLWWNEKTKKKWAFQYYANAPADTA